MHKFIGKQLSEFFASFHFELKFLGVNTTFMPMHWMGTSGMPRRIHEYFEAFKS